MLSKFSIVLTVRVFCREAILKKSYSASIRQLQQDQRDAETRADEAVSRADDVQSELTEVQLELKGALKR